MGTAPPLFKAAHFKKLHKIRNIFIITKELLLLFRLCLCVFECVCVLGVRVGVAVVGVGLVRLGEAVKNSIEQRMLRFNEWEHFDWL